MRAEAHLHITKFRKGEEACISLRRVPNYQVEYAGTVVFSNVKFAVQPAGLRRFRETGQKNVHAFVRGDLIDCTVNEQVLPGRIKGWREAKYNPAVNNTFVDKENGLPLHTARAAYLVGSKVYYIP